MDRLTEYNYKVYHRPCKANIIKIANELSQMPGQYSQFTLAANLKQIALVTTCYPTEPPSKQPIYLPNDEFKQEAQSHKLYQDLKWYSWITLLLLDREKALKDCGQTEKWAIRQTALKYRIADRYLVHLDRGGETAKCVLPNKVGGILKWVHNKHRHFLSPLTLHKLQEQWFWSHQSSDVKKYCRTCEICQFKRPRKPSMTIWHIIQFSPFAMIDMDFLGPITLECKATKAKYVLIIIHYFLKFVWAQTYAQAN